MECAVFLTMTPRLWNTFGVQQGSGTFPGWRPLRELTPGYSMCNASGVEASPNPTGNSLNDQANESLTQPDRFRGQADVLFPSEVGGLVRYTPNAQRPTVHIMIGMRITKSRSTQMPAFTMRGRLTRPEP